MTQRKSVLDADALSKLETLGLLNALRNIFETVLIPETVKNEYARHARHKAEPKLDQFISNLNIDYGFFRLCTSFDSIVLAMIQGNKDIHDGEAEALAQQKKVGAHLIISDDGKFKKAALQIDPSLRILNVLGVAAALDLHGFLNDLSVILSKMHTHQFRFTAPGVRKAYQEASSYLQSDLDRKTLRRKEDQARESIKQFSAIPKRN